MKLQASMKFQPQINYHFSSTPKAAHQLFAIMDHHHPHILLVTFPGQGHINPSLQFAKRLVKLGAKVTFMTAFSALNRMSSHPIPAPEGLTIVGFSDGYDDGFKPGYDREHFLSELRNRGSLAVRELITESSNKGRPFTRIVYTTLLSWVGKVAHSLDFPSTFLWIQPATALDIYYHYFHGYSDKMKNISDDSIELPGLPLLLTSHDLPSFLIASNQFKSAISIFEEHVEILDSETNPKVLVNSLDALEPEALRAIEKLNMVAIGPLVPILDEKDPAAADTSFRAHLFRKSRNYVEWLNSKAEESVVYVSFGSVCELSREQLEEIGRGLLESRRPFLWVIREKDGEDHDKMSCEEELGNQGMIVPWCDQLEVLSHPSVGCFVSHCGWNSSLESLVSGVPVVGFPLWSDQGTNAKLIRDVWKTGVRVTPTGNGGPVKGEEIKSCIELVMEDGVKAQEMRKNAKKWRGLAREASKEGGSSDLNLKAFLSEIGTKMA